MGGIDPTPRQQLTLLLVAGRHHLSSGDLRSLIQFLEQEDCGFDVTLQVADPVEHPELLELHRMVVTLEEAWLLTQLEARPTAANDARAPPLAPRERRDAPTR